MGQFTDCTLVQAGYNDCGSYLWVSLILMVPTVVLITLRQFSGITFVSIKQGFAQVEVGSVRILPFAAYWKRVAHSLTTVAVLLDMKGFFCSVDRPAVNFSKVAVGISGFESVTHPQCLSNFSQIILRLK